MAEPDKTRANNILALTSEIVAAHVSNNTVPVRRQSIWDSGG